MPRHSYAKDKQRSNYPTPDNTQPQTNNSLQSSQSSTNPIADSFLSDVTQGFYSEYSTLDNQSANPDLSDLAPHTPESLLYSPAPDASLNDLNSRKQREQPPTLRRSPRNFSNRTPQTSERQSDSASLRSQESPNNQHINRDSPLNVEEKSKLVSVPRMEINTENQDVNELRDLITKSNMILDSVHHSHRSQGGKSLIRHYKAPRLGLERERQHENEYPENVDFVIANEISDTLRRQSEHYNKMASKFSNLKFIKVEPESEEEVEQSTIPITPGMRRSSRKRTATNYSYPRYSYGGSSKRSRTRKRSRSFRKGSLSVLEDGGHADSDAIIERNKDELSPVPSDEEQEANYNTYGIQVEGDSGNIDNNIFGDESPGNLYLKHDLRSRKIMLELPEGAVEHEETEEPVVAAASDRTLRSKRPVKKSVTLKPASKKSVKTIPKRKKSRKSTSRKKNKNSNEVDDNSEAIVVTPVTSTPRGTRSATTPKRKVSSKSTPRKKNEDSELHPNDNVDNESDNNNEAVITAPVKSTPRGTRSATTPKRKESRKSTSRKKNEDLEWRPNDEVDNESDDSTEAVVTASVKSTPRDTRSATTPKRKVSRKSTSRKKNEDLQWHPNDEVDNESDDSTEAVVATPKKATAKKTAKSMDTTPEASSIRKSTSKKATPKTPKIARKVRKPTRVRGRGRARGSRSKNHDTEYKYFGEEETESEIEIDANSENQIVRESSDVEMDIVQDIEPVGEPVSPPTRPKRIRKSIKDSITEPVTSTPRTSGSRSNRGRGGSKRGGRKVINSQVDKDIEKDNDVSIIHETSDEETNVPEVQQTSAIPKKTTKSTRGGKGKGRGGRVGGNTAINQPSTPSIDPDVVEISAGNPMALANAVRALSEQNYDIVHSPEDIANIALAEESRVPVFIKPNNPSSSINSTPPPELQAKSSLHTSSILKWSNDHWRHLKIFYEETKNEFISSGKVVGGNEDVYREVTKKFFDVDINYRTFGEDILRMRIIALESADIEKSNEPSGSVQRRSSIGSNSSRSSRFSVSRYNKAYSNLRDNVSGTKRKRSESNATNATTVPEDKKEENEEDDETEDKNSKRLRIEENLPSGSGTVSAASDMNTPHNNGILSKIFRGWFSSRQSQSNLALPSEETLRESVNNTDENENIMENGGEPQNPTTTRRRSLRQ